MFVGRASNTAVNAQSRVRGYVLKQDLIGVAQLKAMYEKELEDQGAGPRGYVRALLTLVVSNPKGLGKFNASA